MVEVQGAPLKNQCNRLTCKLDKRMISSPCRKLVFPVSTTLLRQLHQRESLSNGRLIAPKRSPEVIASFLAQFSKFRHRVLIIFQIYSRSFLVLESERSHENHASHSILAESPFSLFS